jgi:hypothetical protein
MKKAVFGLVSSQDQARKIVDDLLSSGFANEDISILSPDSTKRENLHTNAHGETAFEETNAHRGKLTTEKHTKAPEGGVTGATAGGLLGGSLGLLAGIGALAIPGIGPFIAAGPIMAALGGSAVGGSLGLLLGSLIGSGIPEYEAKKYENGLKAGNILVSVHTERDEDLSRATEILKRNGAKDISSSHEKSKSSS